MHDTTGNTPTPAVDPDLGPDAAATDDAAAPPHDTQPLDRLREVLTGQRSCMLSTIDAQGRIVSRPMAVQDVEFDGDLWFLTEHDSEKVAELTHDAHASAAFAGDGEWACVSGTATVVRDVATKRELWDTFTDAFFGDREPDDERIVLIHLAGERGEYWTSHSGPRMLVELVRGKLRGERPDVGDHAEVRLTSPGDAS